ncbi:MAG: HlyC/CorC family transporter [bacterium]|nr:HlyC/CorC family transporter [bacterium]
MIINILLAVSCVGLLFASAFFSGSETALFGLDSRQRHFLRKRQDLPARRVTSLLGELSEVLIAVLIGNTFVNILLTILATRIFINIFGMARGMAISSIAVTILLLIFGEIFPKTLAVRDPLPFCIRVARPLLSVMKSLRVLILFFRMLSRKILSGINRVLPVDDLELEEDDMLALLSLAEEEGGIDSREKTLVEGVFELGDTQLHEIMTPRVDLFLLATDTPATEAAVKMRLSGHSRAPVFNESPDQVVGILTADVLLRHEDEETPVGKLIVPPRFCPESQSAGALLLDLLQEEEALAVVLDEYGALAGLVTLEDLCEIMVGRVLGEKDAEDQRFYLVDANTLIASSRLDLEQAAELLNFDLASDEVESLGGYVMEILGEVPEPGKVYRRRGLRITILSAEGPVIRTIKMEKLP